VEAEWVPRSAGLDGSVVGKTLATIRPACKSTVEVAFRWEAFMGILLLIALLLVLFGIVGGIAITKFLFFVLIIAALLAAIGFFTRTA
jgi:hypothetical protein